jgi:hypothetical protein
MSALFVVGFVLTPMPVWSYFGFLAYCLLLALLGVGLVLAGSRLYWCWWFSALLPGSAVIGVGLVQFWSDPETFIQVTERVGPPFLAVLYVWLAFSAVVASAGWLRYVRSYRSAIAAEPGASPAGRRNVTGAILPILFGCVLVLIGSCAGWAAFGEIPRDGTDLVCAVLSGLAATVTLTVAVLCFRQVVREVR